MQDSVSLLVKYGSLSGSFPWPWDFDSGVHLGNPPKDSDEVLLVHWSTAHLTWVHNLGLAELWAFPIYFPSSLQFLLPSPLGMDFLPSIASQLALSSSGAPGFQCRPQPGSSGAPAKLGELAGSWEIQTASGKNATGSHYCPQFAGFLKKNEWFSICCLPLVNFQSPQMIVLTIFSSLLFSRWGVQWQQWDLTFSLHHH